MKNTSPDRLSSLQAEEEVQSCQTHHQLSSVRYAKLFKALANVLDLLIQEVCPDSFRCTNLPAILTDLTPFLQRFPDDSEPAIYNQDFVDSLHPIPVERIIAAIQWLIDRYLSKRRADLETVLFSVDIKEKDTKLRIWKGKRRKSARRVHSMDLRDVLDICKLSCEVSVFTVMGRTFKQTRRAAIGSQISPTLANATVAVREQQFAAQINHLCRRCSISFGVFDMWTIAWSFWMPL